MKWCDDNFLDLNVIDFRRDCLKPAVSVIHSENVETVESYKYLGTVFDFNLKFDINLESLVKQGQKRIYLLWKLDSLNVRRTILCSFVTLLS